MTYFYSWHVCSKCSIITGWVKEGMDGWMDLHLSLRWSGLSAYCLMEVGAKWGKREWLSQCPEIFKNWRSEAMEEDGEGWEGLLRLWPKQVPSGSQTVGLHLSKLRHLSKLDWLQTRVPDVPPLSPSPTKYRAEIWIWLCKRKWLIFRRSYIHLNVLSFKCCIYHKSF